jgi:hypothetical protein
LFIIDLVFSLLLVVAARNDWRPGSRDGRDSSWLVKGMFRVLMKRRRCNRLDYLWERGNGGRQHRISGLVMYEFDVARRPYPDSANHEACADNSALPPPRLGPLSLSGPRDTREPRHGRMPRSANPALGNHPSGHRRRELGSDDVRSRHVAGRLIRFGSLSSAYLRRSLSARRCRAGTNGEPDWLQCSARRRCCGRVHGRIVTRSARAFLSKASSSRHGRRPLPPSTVRLPAGLAGSVGIRETGREPPTARATRVHVAVHTPVSLDVFTRLLASRTFFFPLPFPSLHEARDSRRKTVTCEQGSTGR